MSATRVDNWQNDFVRTKFMRAITEHGAHGINEELEILVLDEPGPGGANHLYHIQDRTPGVLPARAHCAIKFQQGPLQEVGLNGVSNESLLAVVADRLRSFQAGPFACEENAMALMLTERALGVLHARTAKRLARGVEGRNIA
jgi:hypothetical protein